ncbi:MAG TPA: 5-formyltetrahydrofolate cyclo-ligase [Rikenellaceae bacterium]|nr:5-formyltetrahydrofolate cyclo-ligase [Rikenellaceae bacterium]HCZ22117.1 5-formyltetrahydrofolate cyclo-ligase [Rikenellaceae bacterium]
MMEKKQIRAMMRLREDSFMESGVAEDESRRIISALESHPVFSNARCVLAYMSIRGEVDTWDFLERWSETKDMIIPRVAGDSLELCRYDKERLVPGYKGILEPSDDAELVEASEVGLALVPGIAFAPDGQGRFYRMGRGKGFYDRLLPILNCPIAAVSFPFREMDSIPVDAWDRKVDYLFK